MFNLIPNSSRLQVNSSVPKSQIHCIEGLNFSVLIFQVWKVHKVIPIDWKHLKFKKAFVSSEEQRTKEFDRESMKYLCYLYPLIIGAAVYSLVNEVHRRWLKTAFLVKIRDCYIIVCLLLFCRTFIGVDFDGFCCEPALIRRFVQIANKLFCHCWERSIAINIVIDFINHCV